MCAVPTSYSDRHRRHRPQTHCHQAHGSVASQQGQRCIEGKPTPPESRAIFAKDGHYARERLDWEASLVAEDDPAQ